MKIWFRTLLLGVALTGFGLTGCSNTPTPVAPIIEDFDPQGYLGTWYEIIRLPHSFEEGLEQVSAEYRQNADGSLEVTNRGYHTADGEWQTAIGHAEPVAPAMYKVTFFWPFAGGYYISRLNTDADGNYLHAVITSDSHDYFWLLSRQPQVPDNLIDEVLEQAESWGYKKSRMILVDHPAD